MAAQRDPGRLVPSVTGGFAGLGAGGAAGRGAVGRGRAPQPVPLLGGQAGVPDPVAFVLHAGAGAVLAGQHRHQVDVVGAVADRDPAHRVVFFPARAQPGAVHHILRYLRPFGVGEHPVFGGGAHRAVPDRLGVPPLAEHVVRELEQPGQTAEVPPPGRAQRGFQVSGVPVAGDDMRVGVFFPASGAVQVADQPGHVLAARAHLPDHRSPVPAPVHPGGGTPSAASWAHGERHRFRSRMRRNVARNAIRAVAGRGGTVLSSGIGGWPGGLWSGLPPAWPG